MQLEIELEWDEGGKKESIRLGCIYFITESPKRLTRPIVSKQCETIQSSRLLKVIAVRSRNNYFWSYV